MDELGYQPHALARGLASKRSRILALLLPIPERGLGITELEFLVSAADTALARGYHLVLWPSVASTTREIGRLTRQSLVDGVVLMEIHLTDERVAALRKMDFPFAMIGRCDDNTGLDYVDIDFETTADEAVRYLHVQGHTAIALVNQSRQTQERGYGPTVRIGEGFLRAVAKYGVSGSLFYCGSTAAEGAALMRRLPAEQPQITALIVMNDRALPGIVQALDEMGWRIPDDLSLVTVISSPRMGEVFRPALTTFAAPSVELARAGIELLIDQVESAQHRSRQILISCPLVERGSTARPCAQRRNGGARTAAAGTAASATASTAQEESRITV